MIKELGWIIISVSLLFCQNYASRNMYFPITEHNPLNYKDKENWGPENGWTYDELKVFIPDVNYYNRIQFDSSIPFKSDWYKSCKSPVIIVGGDTLYTRESEFGVLFDTMDVIENFPHQYMINENMYSHTTLGLKKFCQNFEAGNIISLTLNDKIHTTYEYDEHRLVSILDTSDMGIRHLTISYSEDYKYVTSGDTLLEILYYKNGALSKITKILNNDTLSYTNFNYKNNGSDIKSVTSHTYTHNENHSGFYLSDTTCDTYRESNIIKKYYAYRTNANQENFELEVKESITYDGDRVIEKQYGTKTLHHEWKLESETQIVYVNDNVSKVVEFRFDGLENKVTSISEREYTYKDNWPILIKDSLTVMNSREVHVNNKSYPISYQGSQTAISSIISNSLATAIHVKQSANKIFFSCNKKISDLAIYSINGTSFTTKLSALQNGQYTIAKSLLSNGIYLYKATLDDCVAVGKIVVK